MSSSEDERWDSDHEELVYSSGGEDGPDLRKKRLTRLKGSRKKSRSMDMNTDEVDEVYHTGLSPRLNRMEIVPQRRLSNHHLDVFYLDEGVETFSVDCEDPRVEAVRRIFVELEQRLHRAALSAGLLASDPAVANLKKQLALRAAELESRIADTLGQNTPSYREALYRILHWLQTASETELREVFEGKAGGLLCLSNGFFNTVPISNLSPVFTPL